MYRVKHPTEARWLAQGESDGFEDKMRKWIRFENIDTDQKLVAYIVLASIAYNHRNHVFIEIMPSDFTQTFTNRASDLYNEGVGGRGLQEALTNCLWQLGVDTQYEMPETAMRIKDYAEEVGLKRSAIEFLCKADGGVIDFEKGGLDFFKYAYKYRPQDVVKAYTKKELRRLRRMPDGYMWLYPPKCWLWEHGGEDSGEEEERAQWGNGEIPEHLREKRR